LATPRPAAELAFAEGEKLAAQLACPFFETSAKTSANVEAPFESLVRVIRQFEAEEKRLEKSDPSTRAVPVEVKRGNDHDSKERRCGGCNIS
jgi:GTPase SAR1 family protein